MGEIFPYIASCAADLVLLLHVFFIGFMVIGTLFIFAGSFKEIRWTRNLPLRGFHLLSMIFVTISTMAGITCPLTDLENVLSGKAQEYEGSFLSYWLKRLISFDAEPWVFVLAYCLFTGLLVMTWFLNPPRTKPGKKGSSSSDISLQ